MMIYLSKMVIFQFAPLNDHIRGSQDATGWLVIFFWSPSGESAHGSKRFFGLA